MLLLLLKYATQRGCQMKKKVMFIAPYQGLANIVKSMDLPTEIDVDIKVGNLEEGAQVAFEAEKRGYDFIISRGGTATKIEQIVSIPVIHIDITGYDILRIFAMITGIDTKVALVGFPNISEGAATICSILEYDVNLITIKSQEEVEATLYDLKSKGYSVVIGDVVTVTHAKKVGLQGILLTSGKEAVSDSFNAGVRMSNLLKNNQSQYSITQNLFDSMPLPTVVLNKEKEIIYQNKEYIKMIQNLITAKTDFNDFLKHIDEEEDNTFYDEGNSISLIAKGFPVDAEEGMLGVILEIKENNFDKGSIKKEMIIENPHIIGNSEYTKKIKELINVYSKSSGEISLIGEGGTGKKTVAEAIHYRKFGANRPFYIIDAKDSVARMSDEIKNQISSIRSGSIMITDMGEIPSESQKEIVGRIDKNVQVFLRHNIVGDTVNEKAISWEYLNVANQNRTIHVPPLRQRHEDIKYFLNYYLSELNAKKGLEILGIKADALNFLEGFFWSGNITQLKKVINEISFASKGHYIELKDVEFLNMYSSLKGTDEISLKIGKLKDIEKQVIQKVMEREKGNQSKTAKILGVNRSTLWRKLND